MDDEIMETVTVYLDADLRCYAEAAEGLRAVETAALVGRKTEEYPRLRLVPLGETWRREDGALFRGEMLIPFGDEFSELEDMREALALLGVTDDA